MLPTHRLVHIQSFCIWHFLFNFPYYPTYVNRFRKFSDIPKGFSKFKWSFDQIDGLCGIACTSNNHVRARVRKLLQWQANINTLSAILLKPSINYAIHQSLTSTNLVNGTIRDAHIKYKERECKSRHGIMWRKFTCKSMQEPTLLLSITYIALHIGFHTLARTLAMDQPRG